MRLCIRPPEVGEGPGPARLASSRLGVLTNEPCMHGLHMPRHASCSLCMHECSHSLQAVQHIIAGLGCRSAVSRDRACVPSPLAQALFACPQALCLRANSTGKPLSDWP